MWSITLYLILGSRSNSVEVHKSTIVTGYARLWQIDWEEIGRSEKSWDIVLQKSTYSCDLL